MTEINLEVKRSGFPIKIGLHEFWFDTRIEHLTTLANATQVANDKLNKVKENIIKSKLEDLDIEKEMENGVVPDEILGAVDLFKEQTKIEFDVLLGDGTFDKLYADYPDVQALRLTLDTLNEQIVLKLEEMQIEYKHLAEAKRNSYITKKANKTKK